MSQSWACSEDPSRALMLRAFVRALVNNTSGKTSVLDLATAHGCASLS